MQRILQNELVPLFQEGLTKEERVNLTPRFLYDVEQDIDDQEVQIVATSKSVAESVAAIKSKIMTDWIDPGPDMRRAKLIPDSAYQKALEYSNEIFKKATDRLALNKLIALTSEELDQAKQYFAELQSQVQPFNKKNILWLEKESTIELLYASGQSDEKSVQLQAFEQRSDQRLGLIYHTQNEGALTNIKVITKTKSVVVDMQVVVPAPPDQVTRAFEKDLVNVPECELISHDNLNVLVRTYRPTEDMAIVIFAMVIWLALIVSVVVTGFTSLFHGIVLGIIIFPLAIAMSHDFSTEERLVIKSVFEMGGRTEILAAGTTSALAWKRIQSTIDCLKASTVEKKTC